MMTTNNNQFPVPHGFRVSNPRVVGLLQVLDLLDHDNDGYDLSPNYDPNDPAKVDLTLCLGSLS